MNVLEQRRRLLLTLATIKDFIIFTNTLLVGNVIESSDLSEVSSGYINIKGRIVEGTDTMMLNETYTYEEAEEYANTKWGEDGWVEIRPQSDGTGWIIEFYNTTVYGGALTIGTYDLTKYKTLKFTVTDYSGEGSVSFGDKSQDIIGSDEYVINIKDYKGTSNIKFSSDNNKGYSVHNIYLEG